MEAVPLGSSCKRGNVPTHWDVLSPSGRSARTDLELQSLRGEHSNCFAAARMKRDLHRWSVLPPYTLQPETHICCFRWGLGAEAQTSEIKPRGEHRGWLHKTA